MSRVGALVSLSGACIGTGLVAGTGHFAVAVAVPIVAGLGYLAFSNRGIFVALMLIVVLDGVPGIDVSGYAAGAARARDLAAVALALVLANRRVPRAAQPEALSIRRLAAGWSSLLIIWWGVTVVRSVNAGIPFADALFGRQYFYFALLLPLALSTQFSKREVQWLLGTLLAATALYAIGEIGTAVGVGQVSWLAHGSVAVDSSGISRVYSPMADLVTVGLCFSLAVVLATGRSSFREMGRVRRWAVAVFVLTATSFALELTRAYYLGISVAVLLMGAWWLMRPGSHTLRARFAVLATTVACLALSVVIVAPHVATEAAKAPVVSRVQRGVNDFVAQSGTVGYRYRVINSMVHLLGTEWPVGLGFLHPADRYFSQLPGGSITNADVGVFNALMTMGVLGAVLIYAPLLCVLGFLMRRRLDESSTAHWVAFGGSMWIVTVLASSATLIVLFSPNGLVLTAGVLAFVVQAVLRQSGGRNESGNGHESEPDRLASDRRPATRSKRANRSPSRGFIGLRG